MSFTFNLENASRLPQQIRFGTSTWTYPGWKGLIYHRKYRSQKAFQNQCLEEYASFPLFRTVGIDRSFYGPLKPELLEQYAEQVPEDFEWISKIWERTTIPKYPTHARYGKFAGKENPDFLNGDLLETEFLDHYRTAAVQKHTGPFVFQFPTISKKMLAQEIFIERLSRFLRALPSEFRYSVEIRNPEYLGKPYFDALNAAGVTHCFNHWNYMPSLREQMVAAAEAGGLTADYFVARILTPQGVNYQQAVKMFEPYDQLKQPDPEMRADVLRLIRRALKRGSRAFVIVNNRAEGNSPLTIDAIISEFAAEAL